MLPVATDRFLSNCLRKKKLRDNTAGNTFYGNRVLEFG